jgi:hypothetical protein
MTVAMAWIGKRRDGSEHLYMATDSRVRGGYYLDACPKILLLPRSDCAICFAGNTGHCYPLMLQLYYAVLAHQPARERHLDIGALKAHILRVFSDILDQIKDPAEPFRKNEASFIFGGYSWKAKDFRLWAIDYDVRNSKFRARSVDGGFHADLARATFIGDRARDARRHVIELLNTRHPEVVELVPLTALGDLVRSATADDTIGGPPQLIRISPSMNTRPFVIRWNGEDTLFGRKLFAYENTDYFTLDVATMRISRPRKFGVRHGTDPGDGSAT